MNILAFDLPYCNHQNLISLVESGHTVYRCAHGDNSYINSLGVKSLPELAYIDFLNSPDKPGLVKSVIHNYDIDAIVNSDPQEGWIWDEFSDQITYIGPCSYVSSLEVNKFEALKFVERLGVKIPDILGIFNSREFDSTTWPKPLVIKPVSRYCSTMVCQAGQDDALQIALHKEYPHKIFVQEYIPDTIEISLNYTVINGEYLIYVLKQDGNLEANYGVHRRDYRDWHTDVFAVDLEPDIEQIVLPPAHRIVRELATYPGNHEGHISGFVTSEDEFYFGEFAMRRYVHNSMPTYLTGDAWLTCMQDDMDTYSKVWRDRRMIQTIVQTPNKLTDHYPMHLHNTYPEIYPPVGLKDNFLTSMGGVIISTEEQHRHIMDAFVSDLENTTGFTANRPY